MRTVWPHSGSSSPAIWVMPSRFFQAAQPVLGLHPFPLGPPVVLGVLLDEPVEAPPELEGRLVRPGGEQVPFVLVESGPRGCVGLGSGVGHGFGVFVGDGPVLEGVLGLGELTELGGGLGPAFGLPRPTVLFAGEAVGGVFGRVRRIGVSLREDAEEAGFAAGGPGPKRFAEAEGFVELGAGQGFGVSPQEGHGCVRIEHQYDCIRVDQCVQVFVTELFERSGGRTRE